MKFLKLSGLILTLAFAACQFVPTRRLPAGSKADHRPVQPRIPGNVALILGRSCSDCHSSSASYPWYGRVAPFSWMVVSHVTRGLKKFDLSIWDARPPSHGEKEDTCDAVSDGSMPLRSYTFLHPRAKLTDDEIDRICSWAHDSSTTALFSSRPAASQP